MITLKSNESGHNGYKERKIRRNDRNAKFLAVVPSLEVVTKQNIMS